MKYQDTHLFLRFLRGKVVRPMNGTLNGHRHVLPELNEYPSRLDMKFKVQVSSLTLGQHNGDTDYVNLLTKETF